MFTHSPRIVTDGLVLYLDAANTKSYPGSGTVWKDLSGNGNDGTLVNGPTFDSNNLGGIKFDATNDIVTIPDNNSLDFDTALTISLWFNRGDILTLAPGDQQNFFVKGNSNVAGGDQVCPSISLFGPTGGGSYYWSAGALGGGSCIMSPPSQILFANQWYNLVFTHISGNAPTPYLNGVKQTNFVVSSGLVTNPLKPNSWRVTLSGDVERTPSTATFNGRMSIVMAYNRALTTSEVLQNYNATKGRFGL